jgi:hypothetical protein
VITPSDSPSSPSDFAGVAVSGFDIQAPQELAGITAAADAAGAVAGAGVVYPRGPRQAEAQAVIQSAPGYGDFDILSGTTAGWPADLTPPGA